MCNKTRLQHAVLQDLSRAVSAVMNDAALHLCTLHPNMQQALLSIKGAVDLLYDTLQYAHIRRKKIAT